ncbi:uncharacterized protein H6S33_002686 [Morchella sextelata]|uniref:uncharacterized protein n=1 Tax=Morchella sextelata TaxID=1174677 RepID=UPI001D0469CC|nr:uncharacterized protein H6S33_002686 [Morchella sextelata]KAH0607652.1 hypothetical protein H6S33_002686 [Morchella sextelata]
MPPPIRFRVGAHAQYFHTSRSHLAARLRPAFAIRHKQQIEDGWRYRVPSIPNDVLLSAHKSKALPFGPAVATRLVADYMPMMANEPNESSGRAICDEHNITPADLTRLALVLIRSAPKDSPAQAQVGFHLLSTCSTLHDPTATIELHRQLSNTKQNPRVVQDLRDTSQRLRKIASEHEHPGALFRMGEMVSQSGKEIEAEKWFEKAAEKGVAAAWTSMGRLQQQRGDTTKAIASFEKGLELDDPYAYLYLATAKDNSPQKETYLLKAAASGIISAAHSLGAHYAKTCKPLLAREWFTLAATEDYAASQMSLAIILREEGKLSEALEWLVKANKEPGQIGQVSEKIRREVELEMGKVEQKEE